MTSFVVAKFGGTSVADYDAMNRSADVVLADPDTRLVVLSASAGVTNLLVALAEGWKRASARRSSKRCTKFSSIFLAACAIQA
ncbi:Lysine-sensitive aspartokinase 3 [Leclercia adecarboxylata]|uniref:Lysine-sensitive aspartokinase 3 n=1 Tax=Leclercia adecarboxylata TaxID=83655 RepID=A0A4U9HER8_9ENTR|nr:Lysine-sensitive aspartokinase 3 [Leclercia adecarboxylata]